MNENQTTITICGKQVKMRYCAATETGFERLSGKTIGEFNSQSQDDLIRLCIAAIIAAYARSGEEQPVSVEDIMQDAKPGDISNMIIELGKIRAAWYYVPPVVEDEVNANPSKGKGKRKNA